MPELEIPVFSRKGQIFTTTVRDDTFGREMATYRWNSCKGWVVTSPKDGSSGLFWLHKLVYAHYHGKIPEGLQIDHKDRNKRNNKPENLRAANRSIQGANKGLVRSNKSGISGVYWDKERGLWSVVIMKNRKSKRLGRFKTREEAAEAARAYYKIAFPGVHHQSELPR